MVSFELISNENGILKYNYWPEDKRSRKAGLIVAQAEECLVELREMAAGDLRQLIKAEELNRMTDMLNAARQQNGEEPDIPYTEEDAISYLYGDLAMSCIWQALQEGVVLEKEQVQ